MGLILTAECVTDICSWALRLRLWPCPLSYLCHALQHAVSVCSHIWNAPLSFCILRACSAPIAVEKLHKVFWDIASMLWQQAESYFYHFCFTVTFQTCERAGGENEASTIQTNLHTHCWAGVGRWVNKIAIFACHIRVTASKDTSAASTLISKWHLTELQQTDWDDP